MSNVKRPRPAPTVAAEAIRRCQLFVYHRKQAKNLSDFQLARKFEVTDRAIAAVTRGRLGRHQLDTEDVHLIQQLVACREEHLAAAAEHTPERIAADLGVREAWVAGQVRLASAQAIADAEAVRGYIECQKRD